MEKDGRDVVEVLQQELSFIEKGGYGRSVRTPWLGKSIFQDSASCLNYGYQNRAHPCSDCHLIDFVPVEHRKEAVPCHYIPLTGTGETIEELESAGNESRMQRLVSNWLRAMINQIQTNRTIRFWRDVDHGQPTGERGTS